MKLEERAIRESAAAAAAVVEATAVITTVSISKEKNK